MGGEGWGSAAEPGEPHVLLFPFPAQGHINPLLDLAHRLAASGVLSTLLLTPIHHHNLSTQQQHPLLRFSALDALPPHIDAQISAGHQGPHLLSLANTELQTPFRTFILPRVHNHTAADNSTTHSDDHGHYTTPLPPISCLISDSFMPWTLQVTSELRISRVEIWTASASSYIFLSSARQLISMGLLPFKQGTQDVPLDFLPGISTSRLGHVPVALLSEPDLSSPLFDSFLSAYEAGANSDRVLVNSFQELEAGAIEALRAKNVRMTAIGPTLGTENKSSSTRAVDEAQGGCLRWLDKQQPGSVVYVAFGSTGFLSEEEIRELATTLEAVGRPFLWAIRDGSATESLPDHFRCLPEEEGLIVSWAPQRQVLAHKSVGAFVSHCGWNSMLESIWSGVPIVGCPRMAEQNTNLWLLQEWGVGVAGVSTIMGGVGSIRSAVLTQALQSVMITGASKADADADVQASKGAFKLRKNVAEMAAAAHAAVSPAGSSSKAFQDFVDELANQSASAPPQF